MLRTKTTVYLSLYNALLAVAWGYVFIHGLTSVVRQAATRGLDVFALVYPAVGNVAVACQVVACLEILHAAFGLVRSSVLPVLLQSAGRVNVLLGVLFFIPEIQETRVTGVMLLVFSFMDLIRYSHYLLSLQGMGPAWLSWLRYTAWIPCYPTGATCEGYTIYHALPIIAARRLHAISLPNVFNIGFDYYTFCVLVLLSYLPAAPVLCSHMIKQRRRWVKARNEAPKTKKIQ
eukprot:TRINITY_DN33870_c0_g1_i1.p1 TRINITY_DN33870_c0_g1~~TRINITY_DN33870_c0_g1_i1.p1  ORF type:complete len:232 (-),score=28.56 TRINITY_DN33870_c0_g1_i1:22-717(-)